MERPATPGVGTVDVCVSGRVVVVESNVDLDHLSRSRELVQGVDEEVGAALLGRRAELFDGGAGASLLQSSGAVAVLLNIEHDGTFEVTTLNLDDVTEEGGDRGRQHERRHQCSVQGNDL